MRDVAMQPADQCMISAGPAIWITSDVAAKALPGKNLRSSSAKVVFFAFNPVLSLGVSADVCHYSYFRLAIRREGDSG